MQIHHYRFRPRFIPTVATLLLLPVLINLGLWQSHKADKKQALQALFDAREKNPPIQISGQALDPETLRYSQVVARGHYDTAHQILLDNQIYQGKAGYQVITPLQIEGSDMRVLVYRGWVPVGTDRQVLPLIETPQVLVEVKGMAHVPSNKYFELGHATDSMSQWQKVWQNLDMQRYQSAVNFPVQPVAILMEISTPASGYVHDWPRPDLKIGVNRGYALQWYAMSVALVLIYLVTNLKKITPEDRGNA